MELPLYQIDAFADRPFAGNPAAVCPLDDWLPDETLQTIALENNLSETAFIVRRGDDFDLRWFTPALEVDLCGHATLATGHLILRLLEPGREEVGFDTRSGRLTVTRDGDGLTMDFPALPPQQAVDPSEPLVAPLGHAPTELYAVEKAHGMPYRMAVYDSAEAVAALRPQFSGLGANVIATAAGEDVDFVSRFFAPMSGIDEDPVTGSAHCTLTPYWANRLDKSDLTARQISARGGELGCRLAGDRVFITGKCVLYLEGRIQLAD